MNRCVRKGLVPWSKIIVTLATLLYRYVQYSTVPFDSLGSNDDRVEGGIGCVQVCDRGGERG